MDEYCCQLVTEVMHLSWRQLPTAIQVTLCETLLRHLAQFTIPLPMISRCVDICQLITEAQAESPEKAREHLKQWAGKLISVRQLRLSKEKKLTIEHRVLVCYMYYTALNKRRSALFDQIWLDSIWPTYVFHISIQNCNTRWAKT